MCQSRSPFRGRRRSLAQLLPGWRGLGAMQSTCDCPAPPSCRPLQPSGSGRLRTRLNRKQLRDCAGNMAGACLVSLPSSFVYMDKRGGLHWRQSSGYAGGLEVFWRRVHSVVSLLVALRRNGCLDWRGSLKLYGCLATAGSLIAFGCLGAHGSLGGNGCLCLSGSLAVIGCLALTGSLAYLGCLRKLGSLYWIGYLISNGSLRPIG